jgi:hypothetical protein
MLRARAAVLIPEAHGQLEDFLDTHLGRHRRGPFRPGRIVVVIALAVSDRDDHAGRSAGRG